MLIKLLARSRCPCKDLYFRAAPHSTLTQHHNVLPQRTDKSDRQTFQISFKDRTFSDQAGTPSIRDIDLSSFPPEQIRNFSIVAHVDHGKSTLADRILEVVGAIDKNQQNKQVLDNLQVEKERGITVKAQSASVLYNFKGKDYILNLIDTPGHVDFSYEVTRSLRACQGVVLLVDANQGVQVPPIGVSYDVLQGFIFRRKLFPTSSLPLQTTFQYYQSSIRSTSLGPIPNL